MTLWEITPKGQNREEQKVKGDNTSMCKVPTHYSNLYIHLMHMELVNSKKVGWLSNCQNIKSVKDTIELLH